jgi:phenylacetate-CoA ligase
VWARYFDEQMETMPAAWTRRLEEELLAEQVSRCYQRAPFYRRKLAGAGVRPAHVRTLEDLQILPFTTREELCDSQAAAPPLGDFVCADQLEIARVDVSSDSTGRPLCFGFTQADLRTSAEIGARALWSCGARPDDVVLQCLSDGGPSAGLAAHAALEATGATAIPVGRDDTGRLLDLWLGLQPTGVLTTSSHGIELAEAAGRAGVEPGSLGLRKLLVAVGRGATPASARAGLKGLWGAEVAGFYGVPGVWGTLAGECEEHDGLHFCGQGGTLVELVAPGSLEPLGIEPGAEGELVFTHLDREASPLLRFRTGEAVSVAGDECSCGRTGARFHLAGASG